MITVAMRNKLARLEHRHRVAQELLKRATNTRHRAAEAMAKTRNVDRILRAAARAHWGRAVAREDAAATEVVNSKIALVDYKGFVEGREERIRSRGRK